MCGEVIHQSAFTPVLQKRVKRDTSTIGSSQQDSEFTSDMVISKIIEIGYLTNST